MKSLFRRLQSLGSREEDYLTEILASVLANDIELANSWLHFLFDDVTEKYDQISVTTQVSYAALKHHSSGSRIDLQMVCSSSKPDSDALVFIESKLGSSEGEQQLESYSDQLQLQRPFSKRKLAYITQYYDPKGKAPHSNDVEFSQKRWHEVYKWLAQRPNHSALARELLLFMQNLGMSRSNQFTPENLVTMIHIAETLAMLRESLNERVAARYGELFGAPSRENRNFKHLWEQRRLIKNSTTVHFERTLGYDFRPTATDGFPRLFFSFVALRNGPAVHAARELLKRVAAEGRRGEWKHEEVAPGWDILTISRSMSDILSAENHVKAAEQCFLDLLEEARELMEQHELLGGPPSTEEIEDS